MFPGTPFSNSGHSCVWENCASPIASHWSEERKSAYLQGQEYQEDLTMEEIRLNWIANFIWGVADDVLRDL